MKRLVNTNVVIDKDTGEVLSTEERYINKSAEPDYVKLYIDAWCAFKAVKGVNINFLYKLLPLMTYANDGQYIGATTFFRKMIAEELGWSEKSALNRFAQEIKKLCNAGVLKRVSSQTYQVNPELIGKGEWKDIKKLRATFNLETGEVSHSYQKEGRSPKPAPLRMVN